MVTADAKQGDRDDTLAQTMSTSLPELAPECPVDIELMVRTPIFRNGGAPSEQGRRAQRMLDFFTTKDFAASRLVYHEILGDAATDPRTRVGSLKELGALFRIDPQGSEASVESDCQCVTTKTQLCGWRRWVSWD